VSEAE